MPIRGSPNGAHHPYPQLVAIARNGGRDPSERVVVFNWNEWSRSIGIAGRDQPVRAARSLATTLPAAPPVRLAGRSRDA
jgi:hypothetical protein